MPVASVSLIVFLGPLVFLKEPPLGFCLWVYLYFIFIFIGRRRVTGVLARGREGVRVYDRAAQNGSLAKR